MTDHDVGPLFADRQVRYDMIARRLGWRDHDAEVQDSKRMNQQAVERYPGEAMQAVATWPHDGSAIYCLC
jgi:hypothetical protein